MVIVHLNVAVVPAGTAVTEVPGEVEVVIVAVPETRPNVVATGLGLAVTDETVVPFGYLVSLFHLDKVLLRMFRFLLLIRNMRLTNVNPPLRSIRVTPTKLLLDQF